MFVVVTCHSERLHYCFRRSSHRVWHGCCWNRRRSFWLFLPFETLLPSPENFAVDPPEFLAATGGVAGSVQNRSCLISLFWVES
ncbi:uncharacterized protein DS421_18g625930 [Arachis hypogaea]|nr:uncharacterized protein DS421_18g625930 [Arachis hypogaea]